MQKLPKILEREPLVDAVFEVRLSEAPLLSDLLPGFLFHALDPKPSVTRLPAADIPQPMRTRDPGLQFAPSQRLEWGQYNILVGDRNFIISCKMPYPKWPSFKATILDIVGHIASLGITGEVDRYSVKYVNLIEAPTLQDQIHKIKMAITLGDIEVAADNVNLQVHRKEGDTIHILSVTIGASGNFPDGRHAPGAVVDIDSIRTVGNSDFATFAASFEPDLESLRQSNKEKFFGCLTDAAIEEMGPIYE